MPVGLELRDRNEAFDVVADVDDDALVHQADDLAGELRADRIGLTDAEPRIFLGLLEAEADALVLASMLRITTSTASPFFTTSDGCWTRFVQLMSEM